MTKTREENAMDLMRESVGNGAVVGKTDNTGCVYTYTKKQGDGTISFSECGSQDEAERALMRDIVALAKSHQLVYPKKVISHAWHDSGYKLSPKSFDVDDDTYIFLKEEPIQETQFGVQVTALFRNFINEHLDVEWKECERLGKLFAEYIDGMDWIETDKSTLFIRTASFNNGNMIRHTYKPATVCAQCDYGALLCDKGFPYKAQDGVFTCSDFKEYSP